MDDWLWLDARVERVSREIEQVSKTEKACQRVMSVPGNPVHDLARLHHPQAQPLRSGRCCSSDRPARRHHRVASATGVEREAVAAGRGAVNMEIGLWPADAWARPRLKLHARQVSRYFADVKIVGICKERPMSEAETATMVLAGVVAWGGNRGTQETKSKENGCKEHGAHNVPFQVFGDRLRAGNLTPT